ncbi:MAG: dCTP deaminase [Candidatus Tokpelaia sp. JSC161]|jgi:dCTP deaminase|nr:MAG: dCTP deaminase [Candidatus Tokpelaia sp. JSC161]
MRGSSGILADKNIVTLFHKGALISAMPLDSNQIQPASLDVRLGEKAYRVRASFMPGSKMCVKDKIERFKLHEISLKEGAVLEKGCVYIVQLLESLALPDHISASANPKSSIGRLDIFTRVLTDYAHEFDKISIGYHGPLYLEISPCTFPIFVRTGSRLSQIRFRQGLCRLDEAMLLQLHARNMLISDDKPNMSGGGVAISVDLIGTGDHLVGYRGKRHTGVINIDEYATYDFRDFWEPIYDDGTRELLLDPNEFYILVSREVIQVPSLYAAEMIPFDPFLGEFRVHYAGFFDPGFGDPETGGKDAQAVLEVRSHEIPFILEHGQIIGRLVYESMLERAERPYGRAIGSHYQAQGLKLSKHFKTGKE